MKCYRCIYYKESEGYSEYTNCCEKFGFEYFNTYNKEECPYIDDDYCLTDEGVYLSEILL